MDEWQLTSITHFWKGLNLTQEEKAKSNLIFSLELHPTENSRTLYHVLTENGSKDELHQNIWKTG